MKTMKPASAAFFLFALCHHGVACAQTPKPDPVALANPLVGPNPYRGATAAGAARPFPLVRLGPDTLKPSTSGYNSEQPILGFSHTHTSGTGGIGYYGNIRLTPQTDALDVVDMASPKADEFNQPGLYRVRLTRYNVGVELTSTARAGVHRYTYPPGATPRILVDLAAVVNTRSASDPSSVCTAATGSFVSDRRIKGQASFESDYGKFPHTVYFAAEFSRPIAKRAVWLESDIEQDADSVASARGQRSGLIATFAPNGAPVEARVGISFQSVENARAHLAPTLARSFDDLTKESQQVWRKALAKIEVRGGTDKERRQFYSALYHTQLMPTDMTGDHGQWKTTEPHFDDIHAVWDTFRCTYALDTLVAPDTMRRILRSQLDIYKHKGWLPDYWRGRRFNILQGGTNMDVVIADALVKRLGGFDAALAYQAIRKDATTPYPAGGGWTLYGRHEPYFSLGYLPAASATEIKYRSPVSTTLEYTYNDFCVAQAAQVLGKTGDAQKFLAQSDNVWKLFQPDTKFFWAKNDRGEWLGGFDPNRYAGGDGFFHEGTAWGYRFYAPHDMAGLIERHGGASPFVAALDAYFDGGKHNAGNEPNFLTPWLYHYAGRPDKSADRVRAQLSKDYQLAPAAYSGDDDSGAMSAWYVFGAMGFYPVAGQDVYLLGSPLFSSTRLTLENGRTVTITARGLSQKNRYVQSATRNGRPWDQAWFRHSDIAHGADFTLQMGPSPSRWGTRALPPSRTLTLVRGAAVPSSPPLAAKKGKAIKSAP